MNKCSNKPQGLNGGMWYYEEPGSIRLVINRRWFQENADNDGIIVKITRRKLQASLDRMNASRRKRG